MNADYQARIAPFIDVIFYVTSVWWEQPRNHRGLDIATPTALGNVPVYSMCDGTIVTNAYNEGGYGNYIIMKDDTTGMGFLYAHLVERSPLLVGSKIKIGEQVGREGSTGNSTGIHLHVEMQDISTHNWIYGADKSYYENPAEFMGFPNVEGISVYYDGVPYIPPVENKKRKNFPWVLYARKLRKNK